MGLILKVLVSSLNYQQFELLSLSVAEISTEEEAFVAPFLFITTRVSVHKNGATKASSLSDISAIEILSVLNCW